MTKINKHARGKKRATNLYMNNFDNNNAEVTIADKPEARVITNESKATSFEGGAYSEINKINEPATIVTTVNESKDIKGSTSEINKTNEAPTVVISSSKDISDTSVFLYSYTQNGVTTECNKEEFEASIDLIGFEYRTKLRK